MASNPAADAEVPSKWKTPASQEGSELPAKKRCARTVLCASTGGGAGIAWERTITWDEAQAMSYVRNQGEDIGWSRILLPAAVSEAGFALIVQALAGYQNVSVVGATPTHEL